MNGLKQPDRPFAVIVWGDAKVVQDEVKVEDLSISPTTLFYTVGWIVKENSEGYWIAAEWAPEDHTWRTITSMPRDWVKEVVYLSGTKKRVKKVKAAVPEQTPGAAAISGG